MSDFQGQQLLLSLDKVIPSDPSMLDNAVAEIMLAINRLVCWEDTDKIGIAIGEALANAIVHGNHRDPRKKVRISLALNDNCDLLVSVKDSGSGFDPSALPDPIVAENLLAKHGRGLFLIRHFMDEVEFNFDHGTEVRMRRRQQWLE
jgi:anti-sigma regulatory factor (Ser/Thr protein kinase)